MAHLLCTCSDLFFGSAVLDSVLVVLQTLSSAALFSSCFLVTLESSACSAFSSAFAA